MSTIPKTEPGAPFTLQATLTRAGVQPDGANFVVPLPLPPDRFVASYGDRAERTLPLSFPGDLVADWQIVLDPGEQLADGIEHAGLEVFAGEGDLEAEGADQLVVVAAFLKELEGGGVVVFVHRGLGLAGFGKHAVAGPGDEAGEGEDADEGDGDAPEVDGGDQQGEAEEPADGT